MVSGPAVPAFPARRGRRGLPQTSAPADLFQGIPGGEKKSEYGADIRTWPKWPGWAKQALRDAYGPYAAWAQGACPLYAAYAASGFAVKPDGFDAAFSSVTDLDPHPVADPPVNIQPDDPLTADIPWAMLESKDAFALYVRLVAAQLAMEIGGCLPWSVTGYSPADLAPLFDGRLFARYVTEGPSYWGDMTETGHVITTTVTPAPPLIVLGFLAQNGLIGSNRVETLTRVLEWERNNLRHYIGGEPNPPLGAGVVYFGYNGRAPVSRMINGTSMVAPVFQSNGGFFFDPAVRHWVGGCGGAAGFTAAVLRLVNIPAHISAHSHWHNRFAVGNGVHVATAHGDDPYGLAGAPEIPTSGILLDDATFHAWFLDEDDSDVWERYVGRRHADLYLQYLPVYLVKKHCQDLAAGASHADSKVYGSVFSTTYSVAEVESLGLWTGLDAKVISLGGCAAIGP
jgi:hypothetical protein